MRTLDALHRLRGRYGAAASRRRARLLAHVAARGSGARSWAALARLHDDLLFLHAFPDSPQVLRLARRALTRVVREMERAPPRTRARGDDSGAAGTTSRYAWAFDVARWIAAGFPGEAAIDWDAVADPAALAQLIAAGVARAEDDAFDETGLDARGWLAEAARAAGPTGAAHVRQSASSARVAPTTDLAALMALTPPRADAATLFARMYDAAGVGLAWDFARSSAAAGRNILPPRRPAFRDGMRRPPRDIAPHIATPLAGIRRAGPAEARRLIHAARAALASRCREVFAITNANPREVWLAPLGEGAELALFGLPRDLRVSIEANYAYVLFINGVPAAYGGVTTLFRQANTGINVFPAFRGSEAAFLWAQMLRAFHSLFGVTRLVVNAVQFGEDNDEALASGAYWFYWRLGFRPASKALAALAAREARRLAAKRGARTSRALLRKLAVGDLHLALPAARDNDFFDERLLARCARLATRALARTGAPNRADAEGALAARVAIDLGVRIARWRAAERAAFTRMAPVVSIIPRLRAWPATDRTAAASAMRAKGAPTERSFAQAATRAPRLFRALMQAAAR